MLTQRILIQSRAVCSIGAFYLMSAAMAAHGATIAADSYDVPPYTVGALAGQAVGGTGFTGTWNNPQGDGLQVLSNGLIGRGSTNDPLAADTAAFANGGFSVTSGQLFISFYINNTSASGLSNGTQLDLNTTLGNASTVLGAFSPTGSYIFAAQTSFSSDDTSAIASSSTPTTMGEHHLVGVLDFSNHQIAIFVDPTSSSYYAANGSNNSNGVASWNPPTSYTAQSYSLVDNNSDTATFGDVSFTTDFQPLGSTVPEPSTVVFMVCLGVAGVARYVWNRRRAVVVS